MEHPELFEPLQLGALELPNRIVMAPMTRNRAGEGNEPTGLHAQHFAQRASAGLLMSPASQISPEGVGYPNTPGIHTPGQVKAWRAVTEAVHEAGGRIALQLWHVGRISHPALQPNGQTPVAPSAVKPSGKAMTHAGPQPFVEPRALESREIPRVVEAYRQAALNAKTAGFDAVEVHGANGYLLDQFLRDGSNRRHDEYGGSATHRARLLLEVCAVVADAVGPGRTGVRLSPTSPFNSMSDSDPEETFGTAVELLDGLGLAWLHVVEPLDSGPDRDARVTPQLRERWSGGFILNGDYTPERGARALAAGEGDAVSFGRPFIANPDLVERIRQGAELAEPDREDWYGGGAEGYVDYPALEQAGER